MQRKNLEQSGLISGVTDKGLAAPISIPGVASVKVYEANLPKSANRLGALKDAAASQATVGGVTSGKTFTSNKDHFDDKDRDTLDPFIYRAKASYGSDATALELDYQNSHKFTGYVVKVTDGASGTSLTMAERQPLTGGAKGVAGSYSNIHADTGGSKLAGLTGLNPESRQQVNEEHVDAVTKIAGEGARWVAVRNHAGSLKDTSKFYTQDPTREPNVYGVGFRSLWLSWKSVFDKKYNISNSEFSNKLKNSWQKFKGDPVKSYLKTSVTSDDYNLD